MATRALVTGATSGIGNAFARELAKRGHDLVLVARDTVRLEEVAASLRERHTVDVEVLTADLATPEGVEATVNAITTGRRPVDLVVNNAGSSIAGWFGTTDIADEDSQLDLLVRAPMHLMDAAIKAMSGRGHGSVINVSSVAAYTPRGAYAAHKAWLLSISQWANLHYADTGVKVMALCPGFVRTEFHQRMQADMSDVPRWMWLRADPLVRAALRDLHKGKAVSVPSWRYRVLAFWAKHLPASRVARVARRGR